VTDPAYSSLEKWRSVGTTTRLKNSKASSNAWFPVVPNEYFDEFFQECFRVLRKNTHLYVMCDPDTYVIIHPKVVAAGFDLKKPLIWNKVGHKQAIHCPHCGVFVTETQGPGSPGTGYPYRSCYEMILFAQKGKRRPPPTRNVRDVQDVPRIKHKAAYPTEKPVELLKIFVQQSSLELDVVLDPFAGSGATLIAAQQLNRVGIGFDISDAAIEHYRKSNAETLSFFA